MRIFVLVSLAATLLSSMGWAQQPPEWLPQQAEENAARALIGRLSQLGVIEGKSDQEFLEGGRKMIADMRNRLETLGVDGVVALAPEIPSQPYPPPKDPILAAMSKYGLCRFPLEVVANDETLTGPDARQRFASTIHLFLIDLANHYLRTQYHARGGVEAEIEEALTGEPLDSVAAKVQTDRDASQAVMNECAPNLEKLLDGK